MKIDISKAAGMSLAKPVISNKGATLLPEGIVLTDAVIRALSKQNIQHVDVHERTNLEDSASLDEQKEYIEQLFKPFTNSLMRELKECLLQKMS